MSHVYHKIAILATLGAALAACDTGGLLTVEPHDGGGGSGGHGGNCTNTIDTSTDQPVGKCADAGQCTADADCKSMPCAAGVCTPNGCALSPLPAGVPCNDLGFVCGGLGQCLCMGCLNADGMCQSGNACDGGVK